MIGSIDELFEESYLTSLLAQWRMHVGLVLKTLPSG